MGPRILPCRVCANCWNRKAEVRLVVTQPDRPSGRGRKICESPVKTLANEAGIPIYQPERIRGGEVIENIRSYGAECAVVVAFGQILPQSFLDIFASWNLERPRVSFAEATGGPRPSSAPYWRGRAWTGISIMLLDAGMDTGPVLSQKKVLIGPEDTFGTVYQNLAEQGAELLADTLRDWTAGRLAPGFRMKVWLLTPLRSKKRSFGLIGILRQKIL